MKKVMVTRFNNDTWRENQRWREKNDFAGCVYNAPVYIKEDIPLMITMYVVEMNNNTNKILGIGRILNKVHTDRRYKIYSDQNYNRFTYRGKLRIDRDNIDPIELEKMEKRLFKSKGHLKRGQGISRVPQDVTNEYLKFIDSLFIF
jgi:hypothetical protein